MQFDAFGNPINTAVVTNSETVEKEKKPKAKYWLNVGLMLPNPNKEGELQFVQVAGCGIGLDTALRPDIKGSKEFQQLLTTQVTLLDKLTERAGKLEVGTSIVLPHLENGFAIQLTHADTRDQEQRKADGAVDNPYLKALNSLNI